MRGLIAGFALVASCYKPSPQGGAPCTTDGHCPAGLMCIAGACVSTAPGIDATLPVDDGPPGFDGGVDGMLDAVTQDATPDATGVCTSFAGQFDTCAIVFSGMDVNITTAALYNTDTQSFTNGPSLTGVLETGGGGAPISVIAVHSFTIAGAGSVRVTGSRAFGIAAQTSISIAGLIDATANPMTSGAACNLAGAIGQQGTANAGGAPGGGGGGFQGKGGNGGLGDNNGMPQQGAGGGNILALPTGPVVGCAGGTGGLGGGGQGGVGGRPGGAVYLVAVGQISITGSINAGGGGGGGGASADGGGGGGGSGGMILLESQMMTGVKGVLAANGGAGGGGADMSTSANPGATGADGNAPAAGGSPAPNGSRGANGSSGATAAGPSNIAVPDGAGGGGGGAAGYIAIKGTASTLPGSIISPAASTWNGP